MTPAFAFWVPSFVPTTLNKLMTCHWGTAGRLKQDDKEMIGTYFKCSGIPKATGPRRLSFMVVLPKGKRFPDKDSFPKVVRDALKSCGALLDDTPRLCLDGKVSYARAMGEDAWGTLVLLEDVG